MFGLMFRLFSFVNRIKALRGKYGISKRTDVFEGNVFWFCIPYTPSLEIPRSLTISSQNNLIDTSISSINNSSSNHIKVSKLKILVINDRYSVLKSTIDLLLSLDHVVDINENIEDSVRMTLQQSSSGHPYDAVIIGWLFNILVFSEAIFITHISTNNIDNNIL